MLSVRAIRSFLALLLLGTWFTCTVRCSLEMMAVGNSLTCCDNGNLQSNASHTPTDADHCVCGWMKSGGYAFTKNISLAYGPNHLSLLSAISSSDGESLTDPALPRINFSPPELPTAWQFFFRAASSPRAPSLVS